MNNLQINIENYLDYCKLQKRLDLKTLKAYRIDLLQFSEYLSITKVIKISPDILETYIAKLHQTIRSQNRKTKDCLTKSFLSLS